MDSSSRTIPLTHNMTAICDKDLYNGLMHFRWRAVKYQRSWYARTLTDPLNKKAGFSMHRLVARTPSDMVCHHRNRNTLDNRRSNLLNLSRQDHELLHKNNTLQIKYADKSEAPSMISSGICSGFGPDVVDCPGNPKSGYE